MNEKESPHATLQASSNEHNTSPAASGTAIAGPGTDQPQVEEKIEVDEPPDGGYGWVCVMCTFVINAHTWGINSSYVMYSFKNFLFRFDLES